MYLPTAIQYENPPSGAHRGVCVAFIDLGTQKDDFKGKITVARKVRIRWELVDENDAEGKPFAISQRYTWSMNDRSNLRKMLESWRGKPFEKADFGPGGFDTRKLIGVPALITIVHKDKAERGVRAEIAAISPLPKSMEKPTTWVGPAIYIALEKGEFDAKAFELLPDNTKEQIKVSPEYQKLMGKNVNIPSHHAAGPDELDDEIPF